MDVTDFGKVIDKTAVTERYCMKGFDEESIGATQYQ